MKGVTMSRTVISTNWQRLFKNIDLFLFNKAPELDEELWKLNSREGEVMQWYLIKPSDKDYIESLAMDDLNITYSKVLDEYVLPVYHYGTSWEYVPIRIRVDSDLAYLWEQ